MSHHKTRLRFAYDDERMEWEDKRILIKLIVIGIFFFFSSFHLSRWSDQIMTAVKRRFVSSRLNEMRGRECNWTFLFLKVRETYILHAAYQEIWWDNAVKCCNSADQNDWECDRWCGELIWFRSKNLFLFLIYWHRVEQHRLDGRNQIQNICKERHKSNDESASFQFKSTVIFYARHFKSLQFLYIFLFCFTRKILFYDFYMSSLSHTQARQNKLCDIPLLVIQLKIIRIFHESSWAEKKWCDGRKIKKNAELITNRFTLNLSEPNNTTELSALLWLHCCLCFVCLLTDSPKNSQLSTLLFSLWRLKNIKWLCGKHKMGRIKFMTSHEYLKILWQNFDILGRIFMTKCDNLWWNCR